MEQAGQVIWQIVYALDLYILPQFVTGYPYIIAAMFAGYILHLIPGRYEQQLQDELVDSHLLIKGVALLLMILLVIQVKSSEIVPFIYFQF